MDPDKLKNMNPEKMMENAQHIWQMLDDMADSDPQAYRKFIDKQMSEGKEIAKPPEPHMCVQTNILKPEPGMIFVNIMEWARVPEPKTDEDPIPVMNGTVYKGKDNTGTYSIISVAFCPKVLAEFGIDSSLTAERSMLINLALDFLRDRQKLELSRNFTVLNKKKRYKGTLKKAVETLRCKMDRTDEDFNKNMGKLEKQFLGTLGATGVSSDMKDSLLGQLGNISSDASKHSMEEEYVLDDPAPEKNKKEKEDRVSDILKEPVIKLPGGVILEEGGANTKKETNSKLIQEIGADGKVQNTVSELVCGGCLPKPEFEVKTDSGVMTVKISLPGVSSVRECELDISRKDVHLSVCDKYDLVLPFANHVHDDAAQAKFSKKSSTLTLTLPLL